MIKNEWNLHISLTNARRFFMCNSTVYNHVHVNGLTLINNWHVPHPPPNLRGMPPPHEPWSLADPLPTSHLSDVEIASILSFSEAGWSTRAISQKLHCSQTVVSRTLRKYNFDFFVGQKPWVKHSHKTSIQEDWLLLHIAKQNSSVPLNDVTNISELPISRSTLTIENGATEKKARVSKRRIVCQHFSQGELVLWYRQVLLLKNWGHWLFVKAEVLIGRHIWKFYLTDFFSLLMISSKFPAIQQQLISQLTKVSSSCMTMHLVINRQILQSCLSKPTYQ